MRSGSAGTLTGRLPVRFCVCLLLAGGAGMAVAGKVGPGIEERPAVTASSGSSPDLSITVFEQLQNYQSQIEVLTGRVEELEHALKQARDQEKARYLDTDTRLKQLEQRGASPDAATAAVAVAPAAAPAGAEQALFDRARELIRDKQYDDAITAFGEQIKAYPTGDLFPSAMYWLGEMWQVASTPDLLKAGRYFYRVYNEFPKNNWAPAAMFRHGQLQCREDDVSKGRVTLARVMSQYSGSPEAKKAESALAQCQ